VPRRATAMSRRVFWHGITGKSPVNAIWEGSGNVMCLDVLRALSREARRGARRAARSHRSNAGPARSRRSRWLYRQGPSAAPTANVVGAARGGKKTGTAGGGFAALNGPYRRGMPNCFAATRLAGNHASMYGAVDLASADVAGLLERALP